MHHKIRDDIIVNNNKKRGKYLVEQRANNLNIYSPKDCCMVSEIWVGVLEIRDPKKLIPDPRSGTKGSKKHRIRISN
jgi:hypothetical protein